VRTAAGRAPGSLAQCAEEARLRRRVANAPRRFDAALEENHALLDPIGEPPHHLDRLDQFEELPQAARCRQPVRLRIASSSARPSSSARASVPKAPQQPLAGRDRRLRAANALAEGAQRRAPAVLVVLHEPLGAQGLDRGNGVCRAAQARHVLGRQLRLADEFERRERPSLVLRQRDDELVESGGFASHGSRGDRRSRLAPCPVLVGGGQRPAPG
jgi:hypothetical protein